jgi:hypothetical protein
MLRGVEPATANGLIRVLDYRESGANKENHLITELFGQFTKTTKMPEIQPPSMNFLNRI